MPAANPLGQNCAGPPVSTQAIGLWRPSFLLLCSLQIAKILTSLALVFNTSSVLLTLCGERRVWIRNAIGFSAGEFPWRWAFCGWSLAPPTPQVLVIEDTLQDAR